MSKVGKISWLVCGLSVIVMFAARLILQGWINFLYLPLLFSIVSFLIAIVVDRKTYIEFFAMRTTKHGMNMGVVIMLTLCLSVAINYLGLKFDKSFDLTKEKINTLSEQSVAVVQNLKEPLNILIFYKTKRLKEVAAEIKTDFEKFQQVNPSQVKVRLVNSDFEVELAKKYLQGSETVAAVVEYKGRKIPVQSQPGETVRPTYSESDITSALLKVTREKALNIWVLTGHEEKSFQAAALDGIKLFADALTEEGYVVSNLNLLAGDQIPEKSDVIAIIGPKVALTEAELDQIRSFVRGGGGLFVSIDPGEKHQLALLTKSFGVEFANNYVLNQVVGSDDGVAGAVGIEFSPDSDITKKLPRGALVVFPYASELKKAPDAPAENVYTELVLSHPKSFVSNSPTQYSQSPDRKSHVLGMAVKGPAANLVIFGDSDFLTDFRISGFSHYDLAMNSIAHLFGDSANITIRPKRFEPTQLQLTTSKQVFILSAGVGLPLLLIVLSGVFWYRRRNL